MKTILVAMIAAAFALSLGLSAPALAGPADSGYGALSKKESRCQRAQKQGKPCLMDFGKGDDIEAGTKAPEGVDVITRMQALFGGLIRVRYDFRDAIMASADDF